MIGVAGLRLRNHYLLHAYKPELCGHLSEILYGHSAIILYDATSATNVNENVTALHRNTVLTTDMKARPIAMNVLLFTSSGCSTTSLGGNSGKSFGCIISTVGDGEDFALVLSGAEVDGSGEGRALLEGLRIFECCCW